MPTRGEDRVQLAIGGQVHDAWESYEIDSDLLTPADAWHMTLGLPGGGLPAVVKMGASVEVRVGDEVVMVGAIDDIDDDVGVGTHTLTLAGRDRAAVLVDCSAPIFVARMASLPEIIAKVVRPLGITKIRIDADATRTREKINVEPGDTAWSVLTNAAEANGLWPWFDPDGTLVIGGPDYTQAPVAALTMRRDGRGNNVEELRRRQSMSGRFSEITVLGQTHGTASEPGKHALRASATDSGVTVTRPRTVVDHEADSQAVCRDRARKLIADARLNGFTLQARVKGHHIKAPGMPGNGKLWTPGQRVNVMSEPHGINGTFFLLARRFSGNRRQGAVTELTFKEDGVWVLDAHPHKRKHRRGKNDAGPGEILDLAGGSQ